MHKQKGIEDVRWWQPNLHCKQPVIWSVCLSQMGLGIYLFWWRVCAPTNPKNWWSIWRPSSFGNCIKSIHSYSHRQLDAEQLHRHIWRTKGIPSVNFRTNIIRLQNSWVWLQSKREQNQKYLKTGYLRLWSLHIFTLFRGWPPLRKHSYDVQQIHHFGRADLPILTFCTK